MGGRGRNTDRYYLHWGRQGKHIEGHNNFDSRRSPILISKDHIEELFNQYRGTGKILYERGGVRELVNFKEVIGQARNPFTGQMEDTTWGKIMYANDGGYHIVPYNPVVLGVDEDGKS